MTDEQYATAVRAVLAVVQADIVKDVPTFFRNNIPQDMLQQFATDAARAALDSLTSST